MERTTQLPTQVSTQRARLPPVLRDELREMLRGIQPRLRREAA
jgi:hypothetical protein